RGTLLSSTDGSNWTETQPIHVEGDAGGTNSVWMTRGLLGICHGPAGWIIPTDQAGIVLRSTDGATWSPVSASGPSSATTFWQSFYADGKYWFSAYGITVITADGSQWDYPSVTPAHPTGPVGHAPEGVNPQYLGAGVTFSSLVSSSNGSDWTLAVP